MTSIARNIVDLPLLRFCTGCNVEKSVSEFWVRKTNPHGSYHCKVCEVKRNTTRQKKIRAIDPVAARAKEAKYRDENRLTIRSAQKRYYKKTGQAPYKSGKDYKQKFGITKTEVENILNNQKGLCANRGCGKEIYLGSAE